MVKATTAVFWVLGLGAPMLAGCSSHPAAGGSSGEAVVTPCDATCLAVYDSLRIDGATGAQADLIQQAVADLEAAAPPVLDGLRGDQIIFGLPGDLDPVTWAGVQAAWLKNVKNDPNNASNVGTHWIAMNPGWSDERSLLHETLEIWLANGHGSVNDAFNIQYQDMQLKAKTLGQPLLEGSGSGGGDPYDHFSTAFANAVVWKAGRQVFDWVVIPDPTKNDGELTMVQKYVDPTTVEDEGLMVTALVLTHGP